MFFRWKKNKRIEKNNFKNKIIKLQNAAAYKSQIRKENSSLPVRLFTLLVCSEKTSLFTSLRGSLTLEAACVLPLFLFAMISVLYFVQIVSLSVNLTGAFCETGKELAVYAYVKENGGLPKGQVSDLITGGLSTAYAKSKVIDRAKLKSGNGSLSMIQSSFLKKGKVIDLVGRYRVKYPVTLFPLPKLYILSRGYVRAWTGRDGTNGDGSTAGNGEMVLVTVNGSVYHKDPNCTHIKLSIKTVNQAIVESLRNQSGGKYHPCENCGGGYGSVYITDTGNRYHSSLGCSGLKRGLLLIPASEVEGWQSCSRCGG